MLEASLVCNANVNRALLGGWALYWHGIHKDHACAGKQKSRINRKLQCQGKYRARDTQRVPRRDDRETLTYLSGGQQVVKRDLAEKVTRAEN